MTQKEPDKSELTEADNKMIATLASHLHAIDYTAAQVKQVEFPLWQDMKEDAKKQYLMDAWLLYQAGWRLTQ
jgi:hypothetical protein